MRRGSVGATSRPQVWAGLTWVVVVAVDGGCWSCKVMCLVLWQVSLRAMYTLFPGFWAVAAVHAGDTRGTLLLFSTWCTVESSVCCDCANPSCSREQLGID